MLFQDEDNAKPPFTLRSLHFMWNAQVCVVPFLRKVQGLFGAKSLDEKGMPYEQVFGLLGLIALAVIFSWEHPCTTFLLYYANLLGLVSAILLSILREVQAIS